MKRYLAILLSLTLSSAWVACDITAESYEGEPNVYGIVSTDSSVATIMVGRTTSILDTIEVDTVYDTFWFGDVVVFVDTVTKYPWNGTSGADVVLVSGDERYVLTEDDDSLGYYRTEAMEFSAAETWELEITYPEGEVVAERTTLVDEFELTSPDRDTLLEEDSLKWDPASGVEAYLVSIWLWLTFEDVDTVYIDSFRFHFFQSADTCFLPVEGFMAFFIKPDSLEFSVAALDVNAYDYFYYDYYKNFKALKLEDYMHIEGAWGVFGSQTVKKTRRYVVP